MAILNAVDKTSRAALDMALTGDELFKEIHALIGVAEELKNTLGAFKT